MRFSWAKAVCSCISGLLFCISSVGLATDELGHSDADSAMEVLVPGADGVSHIEMEEIRAWRNWLYERGFTLDRCGQNPRAGLFHVVSRGERDRQILLDAGFQITSRTPGGPVYRGAPDAQYFDPTEIEAMLAQVHADHPAITRMFSIGATSQGRSIWAMEISNQPDAVEDEPAIQFNGQHHARELATSHVVMDIVQTLTDGYGVDPELTRWVDDFTTVCVPMVNPDGVQYAFDLNSLWRRNRRVYPGCTGVDLNRNYPYLWGPGCGSSGSCNDLYRGPSAASELETQAMIGLQDSFHFVMATSYHSYGRFIDYPYACSNGSPSGQMPEHAVIHEMMHGVSDGIFAVDGTRYDVFSPVPFGGVNGDDTSWYYAHRGVYAFIIEIGTSFEPPFAQVAGIVNQNRGGWRYLYERLGQARIDVHVRDACTGEPIEAEVTLKQYVFDTGESARITSLPLGRWTYIVPADGGYTVRATKAGYQPGEADVLVSNVPAAVEIELEPQLPPPGGCVTADIPAASTYGIVTMVLSILIVGALAARRTHRAGGRGA
jgi:hypothetical protein